MHKGRLARGRLLLLTLAVAVLAGGCSKKLPQEVSDLNRVLGEARDACASAYAASDLAAVQADVDSMNALVDDGKFRKARKLAIPLKSRVDGLQANAQSARADALRAAEAAVAAAQAKLDASTAAASTYAPEEQRRAEAKMGEARTALANPCGYNDAARLAQEAGGLADAASAAAIAGKRRADEEAARLAAEAERQRLEAEEEARRRAEEERLRAFPSSYVVARGDSLWKIAGRDNIYGNPVPWVVIHDANRDLIRDPDLIFPGQELKIPRGMSEADLTAKTRQLWRERAR